MTADYAEGRIREALRLAVDKLENTIDRLPFFPI